MVIWCQQLSRTAATWLSHYLTDQAHKPQIGTSPGAFTPSSRTITKTDVAASSTHSFQTRVSPIQQSAVVPVRPAHSSPATFP